MQRKLHRYQAHRRHLSGLLNEVARTELVRDIVDTEIGNAHDFYQAQVDLWFAPPTQAEIAALETEWNKCRRFGFHVNDLGHHNRLYFGIGLNTHSGYFALILFGVAFCFGWYHDWRAMRTTTAATTAATTDPWPTQEDIDAAARAAEQAFNRKNKPR